MRRGAPGRPSGTRCCDVRRGPGSRRVTRVNPGRSGVERAGHIAGHVSPVLSRPHRGSERFRISRSTRLRSETLTDVSSPRAAGPTRRNGDPAMPVAPGFEGRPGATSHDRVVTGNMTAPDPVPHVHESGECTTTATRTCHPSRRAHPGMVTGAVNLRPAAAASRRRALRLRTSPWARSGGQRAGLRHVRHRRRWRQSVRAPSPLQTHLRYAA